MSLWRDNYKEYRRVHDWARGHFRKMGACELCGASGRTELSNKSGNYYYTLSDWQEVCCRCHHNFDYDFHGSKIGFHRNPELLKRLSLENSARNKGRRKLTKLEVMKIEYALTRAGVTFVAWKFNLSRITVYRIKKGEYW